MDRCYVHRRNTCSDAEQRSTVHLTVGVLLLPGRILAEPWDMIAQWSPWWRPSHIPSLIHLPFPFDCQTDYRLFKFVDFNISLTFSCLKTNHTKKKREPPARWLVTAFSCVYTIAEVIFCSFFFIIFFFFFCVPFLCSALN